MLPVKEKSYVTMLSRIRISVKTTAPAFPMRNCDNNKYFFGTANSRSKIKCTVLLIGIEYKNVTELHIAVIFLPKLLES